MAEIQAIDFAHTGPGTLAGRFMRSFWQPVRRAQDVPTGRALPVRMLNEDFTLYRGASGRIHAVAFRCAHRGTQLNVGWVEGDCIRCRYHGWKYDATGQCVEQPGEDPAFAARVRIRSYPVQEYLGLIFVYFGDGEPPAMKLYPDFERPGTVVNDPPLVFPCNYFNQAENDEFHICYTHLASSTRMGRPAGLRRLSAKLTEYGVRSMAVEVEGQQHAGYLDVHIPSTSQIRTTSRGYLNKEVDEDRIFWHVPIDDEHSVRFNASRVHLTGEEGEQLRQRRDRGEGDDNSLIYATGEDVLAGKLTIEDMSTSFSYYQQFYVEDYATQVGQGVFADRTQEHLGQTDVAIILKRKIWERELRALADGEPLTQWPSVALYDD
jgi:5,5'-dehydrodivanillate O-demethylase